MNFLIAMPDGVVRDQFLNPDVVKKLETLGKIIWNDSSEHFSSIELKEKIRDVDVCITGWGCKRFDENVLEDSVRLKLVVHTGAAVAGLVSEALYEKGITVISANSIYAESVAEGVISYILCSLRELMFYSNEVQKGRWRSEDFFNEGLLEQTIGLIGFGAVAKFLVKMLIPFRVKIKVYDPYITDQVCTEYGVQRASLEETITTCKIISIHAAQTPDTYHMINRELLKKIPNGALLINTARGSLIDEAALAEELQTGRFKAVLDVFEEEPLEADSKLRCLPNVILVPHMAGMPIDMRRRTAFYLIQDIENFLNGKELKYKIDKNYAFAMTR